MLEKADFFRSTNDAKSLPQSFAEVLLAGRSNVGKSSVINALCGRKNLARTSKTPGRTRSINVYGVSRGKWIIDLPGYGFAKVSLAEKKLWRAMIEECIAQRKSKKRVYVIIDAFVGPTELDFAMAEWLKESKVAFKIVANKCDKVKQVDCGAVQAKIAECFGTALSDVFTVSARERSGFNELKSDIVKFLK